MNLLIWVYKLLDGVFNIFRILSGLERIDNGKGDSVDLINAFLDNSIVTKIFFGILIVSVVICAICIMVAVVKATVNMNGGERKSLAKISGQGLSTIFISLFMAIIMICGITVANSLLRDINAAFHGSNEQNICNELFDIAVGKGAQEWEPAEYEWEIEKDAMGNDKYDPITKEPIYKEENGQRVRKKVLDSNGNPIVDSSGNYTYVVKSWKLKDPDPNSNNSGWNNKDGAMSNDFNILDQDADTILGKYPTMWIIGWEDSSKTPTFDGKIKWGSFNYLLAYFSAVIVLVAVVSACLGLVKRLYDLVILFLSLPIVVSTIPLDDGARFKVWRETVVSKVIIAYGAVFAVNVFLIMVPMINALNIDKILKMFLVIGGGLSISGGTLLFARLFGTDAAESRDMAQSARTMLAGGMAGMHGIKAVTASTGKVAGKMFGAKSANRAAALGAMGASGNGGAGNGAGLLAAGALGSSGNAAAGSALGKSLSTAGIQSGTWHKDPATGRFISAARAQNLAKKLNKG